VPRVTYAGRAFEVGDGETLLDALLREGEAIPHACRAGACGACLVRVTSGSVPSEAQVGLGQAYTARGCVFACQCRPSSDLSVEAVESSMAVHAHIVERSMLSDDVARVVVRTDAPFEARPGQYATFIRGGIARSFSIAARADARTLELHVRRVTNGAMSPYLCDEARAGDPLVVKGPFGHCHYAACTRDEPLLLAGTGTGLAPLFGVLCDALRAGHKGPIRLFHGAVSPSGLYMRDTLSALAAEHPNVLYVPSVMTGATDGLEEGPLDTVVMRHVPKPQGQKCYVCGAPDLVRALRKKLFLAGARLSDILADEFVPAVS
jgi:CDP-4-dehydro-6-deoxyglucose reductase